MNKHVRYLSIILLFTLLLTQLLSVVSADETIETAFYNRYSLPSTDILHQIISTDDNGYILLGTKQVDYDDRGLDFWLTKTDSDGTIIWENNYGGIATDKASSVLETSSGYYLVGNLILNGETQSDISLIKTNNDGIYQWNKLYPGPNDETAEAMAKTTQGLIIAGSSNSFNDGYDLLVIHTDGNGDKIWIKNYGGTNNQYAVDILQTSDHGFAILGNDQEDFYLIKTDMNGTLLWEEHYGGSENDIPSELIQTSDNGFLLVGSTRTYGIGETDIYVIKTDSNGTIEWQQSFGGRDVDQGQSVFEINQSYIITGYSKHLLSFEPVIISVNKQGYKQWKRYITYPANEYTTSFTMTDDSIACIGQSKLENNHKTFFFKTYPINDSNTPSLYPIADAGPDIKTEPGKSIDFQMQGIDHHGNIVLYEWDFTGDGIYDYETETAQDTTYQYSSEGEYHAMLRVTDDQGLSDLDMKKITVGNHTQASLNKEVFITLALCLILGLTILFLSYDHKHNIRKKLKKTRIKPLQYIAKLHQWSWYLLIAGISTIMLKTTLSFFMESPIIFFDAHSYGIIANQLATGKLSLFSVTGSIPSQTYITHPYPTGYPLMISPAYMITDHMEITYRLTLFFNIVLSVLAMIPVYLMMKQFVNPKLSMITALLVTWLPQMITHNFLVMSETAFITIFLFSCYLLIKVLTYEKIDLRFIILSLITGGLIVFSILIKAIGVALLPALIGVILYRIISKRNVIELKNFTLLIPFLPAIIYLFFMGEDKPLGYGVDRYIDTLFSVFSNGELFNRFVTVVMNEFYYFVLMGYLLFMGFSIYLILYFRKIPKKQRETLGLFMVYSLISTIFLVIITADHIFRGQYTLYTRYVLVGVPVIFMLGIIGMNFFKKRIQKETRYEQYVFLLMLLILIIFLFTGLPEEPLKIVNNLDLHWIVLSVKTPILFTDGFTLIRIIIAIMSMIFFIFIIKKLPRINTNNKKKTKNHTTFIKRIIQQPIMIFIVIALLFSIILSASCLDHHLTESNSVKELKTPGLWFDINNPYATIAVDDFNAAYLGGGMEGRTWWFYYASLYYWSPDSTFVYMNPDEIKQLTNTEKPTIDYLLSTHELTEYFQKIQSFNMNIEASSYHQQKSIDWHLYKIK